MGNHIKLQFHLQTNSSVRSDIGSITIIELLIVIPCEFTVGSYNLLFDLHVRWISITITATENIDTHLHSQCLCILCLTIMQQCLMEDSQFTIIIAPLYCKKVFYKHEQWLTSMKNFLTFMWWTSWQDWEMVSLDEKMKAAIVL